VSEYDLSGFAEATRAGIQEDVSKYDQALAGWKSKVIELVHSADYVHHELGTDCVVPAVALMAEHVAVSPPLNPETPAKNMGVMLGLVVQWLIDLEHENKGLRLALNLSSDQEE
jgi:hypothetical protein